MLEVMTAALRSNGVRYSYCANRSKDFASTGALQAFRTDPEVRVLAMPLHLGAEGLDLVAASHVFLLEPLLNPAQERQAVSRVHRIGQTRTTKIYKYVILQTVEQSVYESTCKKLDALDSDDDAKEESVGDDERQSPLRKARSSKSHSPKSSSSLRKKTMKSDFAMVTSFEEAHELLVMH